MVVLNTTRGAWHSALPIRMHRCERFPDFLWRDLPGNNMDPSWCQHYETHGMSIVMLDYKKECKYIPSHILKPRASLSNENKKSGIHDGVPWSHFFVKVLLPQKKDLASFKSNLQFAMSHLTQIIPWRAPVWLPAKQQIDTATPQASGSKTIKPELLKM